MITHAANIEFSYLKPESLCGHRLELSSSGLELDVAGHGCGVAVELGRLRGVSSSVPARGGDCVSQDPSHDGVDKSGVDKGDVVEVRLVPEFEGWRLLGVHALCVCVDSSGCAVG